MSKHYSPDDARTALVIGAGISGPVAALSLIRHGYSVTVYESRSRAELRSDGILGITRDNWETLRKYGVDISRYELPNKFTQYGGETVESDFHYITWTDLHNAVTDAAEYAGALFHFATKFTEAPDDVDVIVKATGVGSASEVSDSRYTGYAIARGTSDLFAGTPWTAGQFNGPFGRMLFTVGDTPNGASWTLFARRPDGKKGTQYSPVVPSETDWLPAQYQRLVNATPQTQTSRLSDWDVPHQLAERGKRQNVIRVGDANGQIRPSTSMGANLGMREALSAALLAENDQVSWEAEYSLITQRIAWTMEGQSINVADLLQWCVLPQVSHAT